jgi:hypothetical protein
MARIRPVGRALAISMLAAAAACGGSDEEDPAGPGVEPRPIAAAYQLQRVNGIPLPTGDRDHLFINGVLEIHGDGTWCMQWQWRGTINSRVSGDRGTYALSGTSISFSSPAGENATFSGTVGGGGVVTVPYVFGGTPDTFVFAQPADDLTPHCN